MTGRAVIPFVRQLLRRTDRALVLACAVFLALGWWTTALLPVGHEEMSTFPARAPRVLVPGPHGLELEPSCANPDSPAMVRSEARPSLSVCARGLSLPVLIMPYATGVPYWHALASWPLHRGDAFWLRRWDLLAGLLSLVLAHKLVGRLADASAAAVTALLLAVSSPFVILHDLLLQYEATPWMLTMGATLVVFGPPSSTRPSSRRLAIAAALAGLAIVANVKAVFYLGPMLLVAWRAGGLRAIGRRLLWALPVVVLCAAPLVVANLIQGGGGLEAQVAGRASLWGHPITLEDVGGEVINQLRFASDTGTYAFATWERIPVIGVVAAGISAAGIGYATLAAVRFFATGRGNPLAVTCGTLLVLYVAISLKIYNQRPAANYGPLHAIFAITVALAITALARRLSARGWPALADARRTSLVLAVACMVPMAVNTVTRLAAADSLPLSTNPRAERAIAAYLVAHPAPGETIYTTTYNLAGVLDSLGKGAISTVRLDRALQCQGRPEGPENCFEERWRDFLATPGALPARVVLPAVATLSDEPGAMLLTPALLATARQAGASVVVERQFSIGPTSAAMTLVRVSSPP